jgi:hypothetical protein
MAARAIAASFFLVWVASGAMGQTTAPAAAPSDQYQEMLKGIDPNSAEDHYRLGEWAYKNNLNEISQKELKAALALDPSHLRANILLRDVQTKLGKTPATGTAVGPAREANTFSTAIPRDWLITDEEKFRVRMEEIDRNERLPLQFRNNVVERFIKKWRGIQDFKKFEFEDYFRGRVQSDPTWALDYMRTINPDDTDIKDDLIVLNDPKFMVDFRNKVWPIVAASCATSTCHGAGEPKGKLRLFNAAGRNELMDYTNYLLLDGYVSNGRRMVDRNDPEQSLLLQFMLPEDLAKFRHPTTITSAVGRRGDPKFGIVQEWIRSLHQPPHPDYRLKYKPPLGMAIVGATPMVLPPPTSSPATTKP